MKKTCSAGIITLLLFTGCGSFGTRIDDDLLKKYMTKTYNASKDKCFDATIAALREMGTGTEMSDKAQGLIISERVAFYSETRTVYYNNVPVEEYYIASHQYYFRITGDEKYSTVNVYIYRFWQNSQELFVLNADWCNEKVWAPLFKEIGDKLDEI